MKESITQHRQAQRSLCLCHRVSLYGLCYSRSAVELMQCACAAPELMQCTTAHAADVCHVQASRSRVILNNH